MATTPQRFRKRPAKIEAMCFAGSNAETHAVYLWVEQHIGSIEPDSNDSGVTIDPADGRMVIRTREGDMKVEPGDWVIREPFPTNDRRFYPCNPDIFAATYEPVVDQVGEEPTTGVVELPVYVSVGEHGEAQKVGTVTVEPEFVRGA